MEKETGQEAGTIQGANVIKMQARTMPRGRERLVWLLHPDLEEQLPYLSIQSGEAAKFLWNPEGGLGNFDTQRVLNKPVLFEDSCASPGVRVTRESVSSASTRRNFSFSPRPKSAIGYSSPRTVSIS